MRVRIGYAIVDRIMWREQITPRASFSAENPEFSGIRVILRQRPRGRIVTTNRLRLPQCQHFHSGINKIDLNQDTLGFPGAADLSVLHILQIFDQSRPVRLPLQRLARPLARSRHIQSCKMTEHPEVIGSLFDWD